MRLLFDENLSPKLISKLNDIFPLSIHVRDVGLKQSADEGIWNYARQHDYTILTSDNDFRRRALELGPPPRVILVERCDYPLRLIEGLIRKNAIRINTFVQGSDALLILRR